MDAPSLQILRSMRWGLVLALLTLAYGFGLGAAFGAAEEGIKEHLRAGADAAFVERYAEDATKRDKVVAKSWTYFKRAHLHANGLGTTALLLIVLMALLPAAKVEGPPTETTTSPAVAVVGILAVRQGVLRYRALIAFCLGLGALGYALFWMLAGLRAPGLGSTGAAKASLEWLAVPTSGMLIFGLLLVLHSTLVALVFKRRARQ